VNKMNNNVAVDISEVSMKCPYIHEDGDGLLSQTKDCFKIIEIDEQRYRQCSVRNRNRCRTFINEYNRQITRIEGLSDLEIMDLSDIYQIALELYPDEMDVWRKSLLQDEEKAEEPKDNTIRRQRREGKYVDRIRAISRRRFMRFIKPLEYDDTKEVLDGNNRFSLIKLNIDIDKIRTNPEDAERIKGKLEELKKCGKTVRKIDID